MTIQYIIDHVPFHEMSTGTSLILKHEVQAEELSYNHMFLLWKGSPLLVSTNPRLTFAKALALFPQKKSTIIMGKNVSIGQNCHFGNDGFGYEPDEDGELIQIPHLGDVVIGDNVTIHNNVCIDRAVLGSTVIGPGTRIDNHVHIAHGVKIGKNCLIVAGSVIGGSVVIGDNCFIGINASIKNKIKIGNNVTIGMGAVVTKDVPDGETVIGNPAVKYIKK